MALPCAAGRFSRATNLTVPGECALVQPGFFSGVGSLEEVPCATGAFNQHAGQPSCERCASGTYQDQRGQMVCWACEAGYWCTVEQSIACTKYMYQPLASQSLQAACI